VFTARRHAGNPLAVVLDATGLDDAAMQAIAREFNYSETTFVAPPRDARNTAWVRIFTPGGELPFAGHPTVGTACVLAQPGRRGAGIDDMVLEEGAGPVPVRIERDGHAVTGATLTAPHLPSRVAAAPARTEIAEALGLRDEAIAEGAAVWSASVPYLVVPLASVEDLRSCRLNDAAAVALLDDCLAHGLYPVAQRPDGYWEVRMFAPTLGVREDPATGSAAASFAGWLAERAGQGATPATYAVMLHQGAAVGRPSVLRLEIDLTSRIGPNAVSAVRVGGDVVLVSEGHLFA
jgi:trans-2,3-dihydro-3-hydroxyanthranilate isomerase